MRYLLYELLQVRDNVVEQFLNQRPNEVQPERTTVLKEFVNGTRLAAKYVVHRVGFRHDVESFLRSCQPAGMI